MGRFEEVKKIPTAEAIAQLIYDRVFLGYEHGEVKLHHVEEVAEVICLLFEPKCQARVERIFKEINSHWLVETSFYSPPEIRLETDGRISSNGRIYSKPLKKQEWWQALKKREGVE